MSIGTLSPAAVPSSLVGSARMRARALGRLTLQARQLAVSVAGGLHGRRQTGSGDSFWQFRPYVPGVPTRRIDWRRSARSDTLYVRDHEWEIAQTVFLCPDLSPSMLYHSRFAQHSKEVRALVLTMALAEILTYAGERIAIPGLLEPTACRDGARHVAKALQMAAEGARRQSDFSRIRRASHVIILSDFLEDFDLVERRLRHLSERATWIHLVVIADPAEEIFPYQGHVIFRDPETGQELDAARAQDFAMGYRKLYLARRAALRDLGIRYGWRFFVSLTDQPLSAVLAHICLTLVGDSSRGRL